MKRFTASTLLLCSFCFVLLFSQAKADWFWKSTPSSQNTPTTTLMWETEAATALKRADQEGKPLLIFVSADFCHYCRKMESETWSNAGVQEFVDQNFVPLKLIAEQERELVDKLGVTAFPTTIVLSKTQAPSVIRGYASANSLTKQLKPFELMAKMDSEPVSMN